jgi:chromosome segregation ATPase
MTQRQRLRRQPGNDGKVRVLVPRDMLKPSHRASQGDGRNVDRPADLDDASDAQDALRTAIEALQGENTALKGQVETQAALIAELRVGLDQERQAIAGALSRAEAAEARAQAAEAQVRLQAQEAQQTAEALRRDLEAARIAQADAEADADAMRQAEVERRARGRWARLRAAWRGK